MMEIKYFNKVTKTYTSAKESSKFYMDEDFDIYRDEGHSSWELHVSLDIVPHFFLNGKLVYGFGGEIESLQDELIREINDKTITCMNWFVSPYTGVDMITCQYTMTTIGNVKYFVNIEKYHGAEPKVEIYEVDEFDIKSLAKAIREDKRVDMDNVRVDSLLNYIDQKGLSVSDYFSNH